MSQPFFTIGHATRTLDQFVELLMENRVGMVVDVRSMPLSRTNPQFNRDVLSTSLQDYQIGYRHLAALGGLRKKQMPEEESPNDYWRVKSFRRYADYALGSDFAEGMAALRALGSEQRIAIMCAEAVWWRCHRRIIADYLLAGGAEVFHILGRRDVQPAALTPGAHVSSGGKRIEYRAEQPA